MVKKKKELSPVEEIKQLQLRIKELEKSEKSLKETERKFSDIIDNEVEWVWEVDAQGKYAYSNPAVKDILGYRPEEVVGKYFYDFYDAREKEEDKKAAFAVFQRKERFHYFLNKNQHKNGETVWLLTNGVPVLDKNNNLLGYRGSDTDVTKINRVLADFKEQQEKLKRAYRELEETRNMLLQSEKMNIVGQLASGVAHEVRNPLAILTQGVNYLERKFVREEDISKILNMMKDNIERADKIIGNIVDFSRKTKLDISPQAVTAILEKALVLAGHNLKMDNVEVVKKFADSLPQALVDERKIEQVFVNIFLNAIQSMPEGGRLFIRTYLREMTGPGHKVGSRGADYFSLGESAVTVEIEDTGSGIPREYQQKIFEPFFTTKGPRDGTGLGLSITMNIVELHKGIIDISSQESEGTKVSLTLKSVQKNNNRD